MSIVFKLGSTAEVDSFLALMREYYEYDGHGWDEASARSAIAQFLGNPTFGRAWLIQEGGAMVGYVVLTFGFSLQYGGRDSFLDELYLRETHRGQGIGAQVIDFLKAVCRQQGIKALHLEVLNQNQGAYRFYRRLGFVEHDSKFMSLIL